MAPPPPPDARAAGLSLALLLGCGGEAGSNAAGDSRDASNDQRDAPATPRVTTGEGSSNADAAGPGSEPVGGAPSELIEGVERGCDVRELTPSGASLEAMSAFAVRHEGFARRTLYSWTSAEQVAELRADPTLLTRATTAEGERGRASDVILSLADRDELAALLTRPEFENKRFAWSNPWATLLGYGGESYGTHLLRITLRPEAWVGSLIANPDGSFEWRFSDVDGNAVAASDVLAAPERLAAVYFVDLRGSGCGTLGYLGSAFREYFLCNEAMLESYSAYTPEIRAELDRGISALGGLQQALGAGACEYIEGCWPDVALTAWRGEGSGAEDLTQRYLAALAFPSWEYSPTREGVAELLERLGAVAFDEPLEHVYPDPE